MKRSANEAYPGAVADPSPGEFEHLRREVDGGDCVGVAKQVGRPRAGAASELQDITGRLERIERYLHLISARES